MSLRKRFAVGTLFAILAWIVLEGYTPGGLRAGTEVNVDRNMLLWKKGFKYRTQVNADISLTNTKIEVDVEERKAEGEQNRSFLYKGTMAYNTEIAKASEYNGSAMRYYENCSVTKSESVPVELKVDSSVLEIWMARATELVGGGSLPEEWQPHMDVVERNAEVGGGSYIVVRQKPGSPNLLGGQALELAFQSMGDLSRKTFLLEWTRTESIRKGRMAIHPAEIREGKLVKTGGVAGMTVQDVIGRESNSTLLKPQIC